MDLVDDDIRRIATSIERYLDANPAAADTVEGVARWWLGPGESAPRERVERALALLVERGAVARRNGPGGAVVHARAPAPSPGPHRAAPPERQPSSRSCFVCGRDNPAGLHTRWTADRATGEVATTAVLGEATQSYPGLVHGGVVAALLDEAMVRALLVEGGFEDLMVTAKMEVTFRRATPTGVPVTVVGRIAKRGAARASAEAEVRLADGTVTARCAGLLVRQPAEVSAAWAAEKEHWRVDE